MAGAERYEGERRSSGYFVGVEVTRIPLARVLVVGRIVVDRVGRDGDRDAGRNHQATCRIEREKYTRRSHNLSKRARAGLPMWVLWVVAVGGGRWAVGGEW